MPRQARTGEPASDLTRVVGIGAQTATRLRAAGINTVGQLARATVEQVTAACVGLTTPGRAASWIEQAATLASSTGIDGAQPAAPVDTPPPPTRTPPSAPRRTFTVEVRLEGDPARPVTTHVVHLETHQAEGWPAWDRARLLDFLERRIGMDDTHAQPVPTEEPTTQPAAGAEPATSLTIHRYGLLKAAAAVRQSGTATVRLHLDPTELDLPMRGRVVARVDLLAQPLGTGREQALDRRMIDLTSGQTVDARLRAPLPNEDPPFALSAIVRVLVEQPSGPPRSDLGGAVLEIIASNGAG
jgi:hypothetical protein